MLNFDISGLKEEYSKHYDATIAECYEKRKPKHVNQTTKNLYMQACDGIIKNINNYQTKLQEIFLSTQNKMANPFLTTSDYRNALRGITQTQTELKQLSIAVDQLRYIIQNQPTPIPLKYGEKKQQQNKHQPQTKEELKKTCRR